MLPQQKCSENIKEFHRKIQWYTPAFVSNSILPYCRLVGICKKTKKNDRLLAGIFSLFCHTTNKYLWHRGDNNESTDIFWCRITFLQTWYASSCSSLAISTLLEFSQLYMVTILRRRQEKRTQHGLKCFKKTYIYIEREERKYCPCKQLVWGKTFP